MVEGVEAEVSSEKFSERMSDEVFRWRKFA